MIDSEYKVNRGQITKIHVLLGKLPLAKEEMTEYKAELVRQYTDGRETSTTRLSWKEANDLIAGLSLTYVRQAHDDMRVHDAKADRKRKLILHYAHQMGWEVASPQPSQKEREVLRKIDMERVNGWCVKYGRYHKPLNEHSITELSILVAQFERVYKSFLKGV